MKAVSRRVVLGAIAGAAMGPALGVTTTAYPSSLVKIIVPFPPGAPVDSIARGLADALSGVWKRPVLVENRTGGNEIVAGSALLQSQADGHTIMIATDASFSHNTFLFNKLPFDPARDFVPITRVVRLNLALVVSAALPVSNLKEFVALMKSEGSKHNYGSAGAGNTTHLYMEDFKRLAGFDMVHIPYRGLAPVVPDMLNGTVDAMFAGAQLAVPYVKTGKMKILAISGRERASALPDVPTFAEAGYPQFDASSYLGLLAPRGTPKPIAERIAADVTKVLHEKAFAERSLDPFGFDALGETPDQFNAFAKRDRDLSRTRFAFIGVKLD